MAADASLSADAMMPLDASRSNPTVLLAEGENSFAASILPSDGTVNSFKTRKIASGIGGGPVLADGDGFGRGVAPLGDLDGDGVIDLAVGAEGDDTGGSGRGAVYVLFMNSNGTVKRSQKIASGIGGGPTLADGDGFGGALASLGDLNGDGTPDLAVGAPFDDLGIEFANYGAVYVLFLNPDGTVKSSQKIAHNVGGGPSLQPVDAFGSSLASLEDLDGDGVPDLAVGAPSSYTGGSNGGAVHVLFLNLDGTVESTQKIASGTGGGPTFDEYVAFGASAASIADLDRDGVTDLAVASQSLHDVRAAVYLHFLKSDGTVRETKTVYSGLGSPFGPPVASAGDLDADGVPDVAVGEWEEFGPSRGQVLLRLMNTDGTVKGSHAIGNGIGGGPTLARLDGFGSSLASAGDLDGDGVTDLAVGAAGNDTGGDNRGAVYVLFLNAADTRTVVDLDGDTVLDAIENAHPNSGDGNRDRVPDAQQAHVASLPNVKNGAYVTLTVPPATALSDVRAEQEPAAVPALNGISFPFGFFDDDLTGLTPGGSTTVTIYLEDNAGINAFYKFGPTANEPTAHWYRFMFDGVTGAAFFSDRIVVHFVDGQRGDDDLTANGTIVGPGGPAADGRTHPWQNPFSRFDVNDDRRIDPQDVLAIINRLNRGGPLELPVPVTAPTVVQDFLDVSGNNILEPRDVLLVINDLNAHGVRGLGASSLDGLLAGEGEPNDNIHWLPAQGALTPAIGTRTAPAAAVGQEATPLSSNEPRAARMPMPSLPETQRPRPAWHAAVDRCFGTRVTHSGHDGPGGKCSFESRARRSPGTETKRLAGRVLPNHLHAG